MARVRLGLIGDNITRSQSPRLHFEAGRLSGIDVSYERLIPRDLGLDFDAVFDRCTAEGFRGINVTYPYKEQVVPRLDMPDPLIAGIRACNTVLFSPPRPEGHNTDYSGFIAAFRARFPGETPGRVAMAGAGGVGKAVAFALAGLGAVELRVYDRDPGRVQGLAEALAAAGIAMPVVSCTSMNEAAGSIDGLVNCTPLGMIGHPGSAMTLPQMRGADWAFDAVYTPVDTQFLQQADEVGARTLSGYDLFFHQGVDAFRHFTGIDVDAGALQRALSGDMREGARQG